MRVLSLALILSLEMTAAVRASTVTYEQNANGQPYSYSGGYSGNYPSDNNWSQSYTTNGAGDEIAPSNWSTPSYPNGPGIDVSIPNAPVTLNVTVDIGSLLIAYGGEIKMLSGDSLSITGSLSNSGEILVNSNQQSSASVLTFVGSVVSGSGSIVLNDYAADAQVSGTLTQLAGHSISGYGEINAALTNYGVVNATTAQLALLTNATNNGIMEASPGGGLLEVNGVTVTQGTGGQVVAGGGTVQLDGVTITGGAVSSYGGASVNVTSGATFNNVSNSAYVKVLSGNTLTVTGSLNDSGTILVNSDGHGTPAIVNFNGGTVSGAGSIVLNDAGTYAEVTGTLTQAAGHSISGYGEVNAALTNNGLVEASGGELTLLGSAVTNNGTLESYNSGSGGLLDINGITVTQGTGGQIFAEQANVQLDGATISGGALNASNGSVYTVSSGPVTFNSLTSNATVKILSGNTLNVTGSLTDNGTIYVNSNQAGSQSVVNFNGSTVSGTGMVLLNDYNAYAQVTGTLTQGGGHTISGFGQVNAALTNYGSVNANVSGQTLTVNGATTNAGLMEATGGGWLAFGSGALTNFSGNVLTGGTYEANAGSTINLPGLITTNAASIILSGSGASFPAINSLTTNQGLLSVLNGSALTLPGTLQNSGTLTVDGSLTVGGGISLTSNSKMLVCLGGTAQGSGYGWIQMNGPATLNGMLQIECIDGFESQLLNGETFTLCSGTSAISGSFLDVADGERLLTDDGNVSFVVNYGAGSPYGADEIVLSGAEAVPEPGMCGMLVMGGLVAAAWIRCRGNP